WRRRQTSPAAPDANSRNAGSGTGVHVTCTRLPFTSATVAAPWKPPVMLKNGVRSVAPPGVCTWGFADVDAEKSAIVYTTEDVGRVAAKLVGARTRLNCCPAPLPSAWRSNTAAPVPFTRSEVPPIGAGLVADA